MADAETPREAAGIDAAAPGTDPVAPAPAAPDLGAAPDSPPARAGKTRRKRARATAAPRAGRWTLAGVPTEIRDLAKKAAAERSVGVVDWLSEVIAAHAGAAPAPPPASMPEGGPGLDDLPALLRLLPDLARRLEAVETRADAPRIEPERLEEALARIDALDARLGETAERNAALAATIEGASLARLDALPDLTCRIEALTARLAELEARETAMPPAADGEGSNLEDMLGVLEGRLAAVESGKENAAPAFDERFAALEARIAALAERVAATPTPALDELPGLVDLVGKMNRRLKAVETRPRAATNGKTASDKTTDGSATELLARVEILSKRLADLETHRIEPPRPTAFGRRGLGR